MQLKKLFFLLLILLSSGFRGHAQIIGLYKQLELNKSIKDTTISLKYFKKPDTQIINYLDSFYAYLSTKPDINVDSNYFLQIKFTKGYYDKRVYYDKDKIVMIYRNDYASYRYFTEIDTANKSCVFAFFFYKEKLVLCTISSSNKVTANKRINVLKSDFSLVKNLMYEEMGNDVKKEIDIKAKNYTIIAPPPLKEYYLEK